MCRLVFIVFVLIYSNFGWCIINLADVECGIRVVRHGRIVGGEDSLPAELPWTASLWRNGAHQCGATVLNNRWLITAGHCICSVLDEFYKSEQLSAVVGYTDLNLKRENQPISKIVPHPGYKCNKIENDVALLKTLHKLNWTTELRPACLPQPLSQDFSGLLATVAGWGFTSEDRNTGSRPNVLQKTEVLVVPNDECNKMYVNIGKNIKIYSTQMCAGHEDGGRDSCWADSGGPLTIRGENGRAMLIGVVSTGDGCARAKTPGIYTRVSTFTEWIVKSVNSDNLKSGLNWYPRSG